MKTKTINKLIFYVIICLVVDLFCIIGLWIDNTLKPLEIILVYPISIISSVVGIILLIICVEARKVKK